MGFLDGRAHFSESSARCRVPEQPAPLECRDQLHMPQSCVFGKTHTLFGCFLVEGGVVSDLFSVFPLMFFVDWLHSTLISMSHYPLEYSGECFQLLPFQLL